MRLLERYEAAFRDCTAGRPSRRPYLEIVIPSTVDDSLCPAGTHVMSVSIKFLPFELADGDWKTHKDALADLVVDTLAAYAPNLPGAVLHRHVLTPACFEEILFVRNVVFATPLRSVPIAAFFGAGS